MTIIEITALDNGAHRNQSLSSDITPPEGWAKIPAGMAIPSTFPFVGVEARDGVVTSLTPGVVPEPEPEPDPEPSTEDRVEALEAENTLLKAQVQAQSDTTDFLEECIVEMAEIVYS